MMRVVAADFSAPFEANFLLTLPAVGIQRLLKARDGLEQPGWIRPRLR